MKNAGSALTGAHCFNSPAHGETWRLLTCLAVRVIHLLPLRSELVYAHDA